MRYVKFILDDGYFYMQFIQDEQQLGPNYFAVFGDDLAFVMSEFIEHGKLPFSY